MTRTLLLVLAAGLVGGGCKGGNKASAVAKATGPLAPLASIGVMLNKGMNEALAGKGAAGFAPATAVVKPHVLEKLKAEKVASVKLLGLEFELSFTQKEGPGYYLRTFVYAGEDGVSFLDFRGRSGAYRGSVFSDYTGPAAPLGKAAAGLIKYLEAGNCGKISVDVPEDLKKIVRPGRMTESMNKQVERAKSSLASTCKAIPKQATSIKLRIDDFTYGALGADGKMMGMIKGSMRLEDGKLKLKVSRFRKVK